MTVKTVNDASYDELKRVTYLVPMDVIMANIFMLTIVYRSGLVHWIVVVRAYEVCVTVNMYFFIVNVVGNSKF